MPSVPAHPVARLIRLVALLFMPLGLVAAALVITLPRRMNELALGSAEERARGVAEVMASLVAPDLEFDDREHAREAMARLAVQPDLLSAELFDSKGHRFATWPDPGAPATAPEPWHALPVAEVSFRDDRIEVSAAVRAPGGTHGVLRLRFATTAIAAKRRANVAAAGLAAAVVALVGLIFSIATGWFLQRRQAAEGALRRSAESFAALSDSLPVALVLHRDDRILYVNPSAVKLLGGDGPESLVGHPLSEHLAPGETLPVPAGDERVHLDARTLAMARGVVLSVEAASLEIQFGEANAAALVAVNVTERTRLQERLLLSDRMASLGTLTAGVAHEINNPLSVVMANLDFVREQVEQSAGHDEEVASALIEAIDGANRVGRIVRDMKALSRSDGDALGPTDLVGAIEKSLQMVQGHLKHRAQVVRNLRAVPTVLGNESRLVQVFVNLLINAAQALPEGQAQENRIEVTTEATDDGCVIARVRDSGVGIPEQVRERIFDPFFTTKPVGVGTGLGLAIVHNLVRAMDGRIDVDSVEDAGTTFTIRLRQSVAGSRTGSDCGAVPSSGRGKVLVIDDEPAVVRSVERLLGDSHEVTGVQSARVALDRFDGGESYDLILCDLRMPDMSGIELARHLDERHRPLRPRLVFMTGDIGEAGMSGAHSVPVDPTTIAPVLEKPFSRRALLQFVHSNLHIQGPDEAKVQ